MEKPFSLEIEATLENLKRVREFVKDAAAALGLPAQAIGDVELAVDEAVTNVVVHGYGGEGGRLRVEVDTEDAALAVYISDEAPPYDPRQTAAPDLSAPLEDRPIGGVGVLLIQKSVDEVRHRVNMQGGNQLTLIKKGLARDVEGVG